MSNSLAVNLLLLGLFISPVLAGGPSVKGDPKALQEILAAFNRMNAAKTYRMKGAIGGATMVMEAVMPNRYHAKVEWSDGKVFETVRVGSEVRFQTSMGKIIGVSASMCALVPYSGRTHYCGCGALDTSPGCPDEHPDDTEVLEDSKKDLGASGLLEELLGTRVESWKGLGMQGQATPIDGIIVLILSTCSSSESFRRRVTTQQVR